ncbi:MAG: pyridoxal phosphate-dependent aminotransferase [Rhodospirillales bacterium]|nr:pyridoxal phosphate-dependent aminotransferase [Rhodospirillales bacterium]
MKRLGTESAFTVMAKAQALAATGREIINLGIGEPDFKTPDHIVEAAIKALKGGHHGYTHPLGILALREAVVADIQKYRGVTVDPGRVLITPGGKPIMNFAITMFGEPGAEIVYPDPGFPIYGNLIAFSGAKPVPMVLREENGFAFSAKEVLSLITARTRLIILNSPANPTGGVTPKIEMDRLVEGLVSHPNVYILSDEIYSRMLYGKHEHVSALAYEAIRDRVILLDGWSKTYAMTGWRLGYSVWPESLITYAERLAINSHSCVNAAAQHAAIAALKGPQECVDTMVAAFDKRRILCTELLNGLPGVSCIEPGGAFYTFPNISATGISALELQDKILEEAGVATIAGTSFGAAGEGYLRISYANSIENITRAIDQMKAIL